MPILAVNQYLAAVDLIEGLPASLMLARTDEGLTLEQQAKQIGITKLTLSRLEAGSVPTQTTILRCLRWLAQR